MNKIKIIIILWLSLACPAACQKIDLTSGTEKPRVSEIASTEIRKLLESANLQMETTTNYTQDYFVIPYPNGDVPADTGACTDVVIRAFRVAGVDLQKEVHEDMELNFALYPTKWGLLKPDTNIDHRRVPNLQTFFTRKEKSLPITQTRKIIYRATSSRGIWTAKV